MSEMSRTARRAMRAKIHRLTKGVSGKVDASDYGPEENLHSEVKTGARPISRRAFKKGGKVVANEGKDAVKHAGKRPRNGSKAITANTYVNRDVKEANEERDGFKHVGAFKRGGKVKKAAGGLMSPGLYGMQNEPGTSRMVKAAGLKKGGRACKADGGSNDDVPLVKAPKGPIKTRPPESAQPKPRGFDDPDAERIPTDAEARAMRGDGYKKGGKIPTKKWEGSRKDLVEDKKLARKHHMTFKDWEKSDLDKKHDKQQSMKGLKSGGATSVSDGELEGTRPTGGRLARKSGGGNWIAGAIKHPGSLRKALHVKKGHDIPEAKLEKAEHSSNPHLTKKAHLAETLKRMHRKDGGRAKGKTNINIVIGTGQRPAPQPMGGMPPAPGGATPVPVPPPAPGGAPMPMAGAPAPMPAPAGLGAAGPAPMARKSGGRAYRSYKDMDAGAGSGEGRLEKAEIQKHKK